MTRRTCDELSFNRTNTPACDRGATNRSLCDVADQTGEGQTATDLENVLIGETNENPTRGVLGEKDFRLPKPSPIKQGTVIQEARLPGKRRTAKAATSQTLRPVY